MTRFTTCTPRNPVTRREVLDAIWEKKGERRTDLEGMTTSKSVRAALELGSADGGGFGESTPLVRLLAEGKPAGGDKAQQGRCAVRKRVALVLLLVLLMALQATEWQLWCVVEGPQHLGTQLFYSARARVNRLACDDSSPWALQSSCSGAANCSAEFGRKAAQNGVLSALESCHRDRDCKLERPRLRGGTPPRRVALVFHGH